MENNNTGFRAKIQKFGGVLVVWSCQISEHLLHGD